MSGAGLGEAALLSVAARYARLGARVAAAVDAHRDWLETDDDRARLLADLLDAMLRDAAALLSELGQSELQAEAAGLAGRAWGAVSPGFGPVEEPPGEPRTLGGPDDPDPWEPPGG